ncbi:MAG: glucose 1-dehydrogenase [Candidatus Cyclobacteriaceae bacterium M2_1C_046]
MKSFDQKTVIVTGSSFGIGRATAIAFAREGANVVLSDWKEDNTTEETIKKEGGNCIFVKCDVSKEEDIKNLIKKTLETYKKLDIAINNAGIEGDQVPVQEVTNEAWDKLMNINLRGVWLGMKYQLPEMLKNNKGAIVNISSIAGIVGLPNLSPYVASKHAVVGLTKVAALENAQSGIRINALCPGVIKTPMVDRALGGDPEVEEGYRNAIPVKRFGTPEEMAETILFLCSDGAGYITGQAITADGGWVTQ